MLKWKLAAAVAAAVVFSASHAAEIPATGTAYIGLPGLTDALTGGSSNFSGWNYLSLSSGTAGAASDLHMAFTPTSSAQIGELAAASTAAGNVYAQSGSLGTAYALQQFNASFMLNPGQRFTYSMPYTMILGKQLYSEIIDAEVAFNVTGGATPFAVAKDFSTRNWRDPLGTGAESNYIDFDVFNNGASAVTYSFSGTLSAHTYLNASAPAVPEPAPYAMLLGGLGMLLLRRKQFRW